MASPCSGTLAQRWGGGEIQPAGKSLCKGPEASKMVAGEGWGAFSGNAGGVRPSWAHQPLSYR